MTSLNTCLKSKIQAQAGGANRAVTFDGLTALDLVTKNHFPPPVDQSWREDL